MNTIDANTAFNKSVELLYDVVIQEINDAIISATETAQFSAYFDENQDSYIGTLLKTLNCSNQITLLERYYELKGFEFKTFFGVHTEYSDSKSARQILMIDWKPKD